MPAQFDPNLHAAVGAIDHMVDALKWNEARTPAKLALALLVEAAEIQQHIQWLSADDAGRAFEGGPSRSALEGEIADVTINLLGLAAALDLDLNEVVVSKCAELETRYAADPGVRLRPPE